MTAAPSLRLVLYGDGAWAANTLDALCREGRHTVAAVVTRRAPSDGSLAAAAARADVPTLAPARANAARSVEEIAGLAPDLGISVAYDQILRRPLLDAHRLGVINVHAGSLPRYRGRNVVNWAIINGEREIGLTVHHVDEGIDSGDLIAQEMLPIGWTDGYGDVLRRVVERIPALVVATVGAIADGHAARHPQDASCATYFGGRGVGDEWLDWRDSSRDLHNKIRGITRPGPGARTVLGGVPVIIWRAYYDPAWPKYRAIPGQVLPSWLPSPGGGGVLVKTGDSVLLVQEVELPDGGPVAPAWPVGTRLGVDGVALAHDRAVAAAEREEGGRDRGHTGAGGAL